MRVLRVEGPWDVPALIQLKKQESHGKVRQWLHALILVKEGRTAKETADILHLNEKTVRRIVHRYKEEGIKGLDLKYRGRPSQLDEKKAQDLKKRILAGAKKSDHVKILRGRAIQRILCTEYKVDYTLRHVYNVLHRIGLSSLCPRPKHPKGNPQEQEWFKKTLQARKSVSKTDRNRSGSKRGFKMKCG